MTLFAGALLRTIEFVMVTTDASFPGPGERGRGGSRELGSGADDARRRRGPAQRLSGIGGCWAPPPQACGGEAALPGRLGPRWMTHTALPLHHGAELGWQDASSMLYWPVLLLSLWSLLPWAPGA